MNYSVVREIRVYNDAHGDYLRVGADGDGLQLVELRAHDAQGKQTDRIPMDRQQAMLLAAALVEYCSNDKNFEDTP